MSYPELKIGCDVLTISLQGSSAIKSKIDQNYFYNRGINREGTVIGISNNIIYVRHNYQKSTFIAAYLENELREQLRLW